MTPTWRSQVQCSSATDLALFAIHSADSGFSITLFNARINPASSPGVNSSPRALSISGILAEEYKKAWKGIYPIELEYQRSEMQPQFANVATPSEVVICTSFQLEIGEVAGAVHFCMPYATLEPIRDVLYSSTQGDSMEVDRRWVNVLTHEIQAVEITMVAELARTRTTVEQLLAMKAGDFIELDRAPRIQATVDGVPMFECQYGTHNAKYAIRIDKSLRKFDLDWMGDRNGN